MTQSAQIVPVVAGNNVSIGVEAVSLGGGVEQPSFALENFTPLNLSDLSDKIVAVAGVVEDALRRIEPDSGSVEFGLDVAVESGALTALLVKGTGTATLKVTLNWAKQTGGATSAG